MDDHVPMICARNTRQRVPIISLTQARDFVLTRRPFKASSLEGELYKSSQGLLYLVWLQEANLLLVDFHGEWYASEKLRHSAERALKALESNKRARLILEMMGLVSPSYVRDSRMLGVLVNHGKEGVVRRMMGLE